LVSFYLFSLHYHTFSAQSLFGKWIGNVSRSLKARLGPIRDMASQKRIRADALKNLRLAREGGGRAKQYKVCIVATAQIIVARLTNYTG
jgi:hypothetical protein